MLYPGLRRPLERTCAVFSDLKVNSFVSGKLLCIPKDQLLYTGSQH